MIHRRSFITGLISLVAAPAIVRVGSIMPVRVMDPVITLAEYAKRFSDEEFRNIIIEVMVKSSDVFDGIPFEGLGSIPPPPQVRWGALICQSCCKC